MNVAAKEYSRSNGAHGLKSSTLWARYQLCPSSQCSAWYWKKIPEAPHPSEFGELDMQAIMKKLREHEYDGPLRPDHGLMI